VPLTEAQAHYLFSVMRMSRGASLLVFNGLHGEWRAEVTEAGRRGGQLRCDAQTAPQPAMADLWLMFAPVKKARTDFIVEKAVELGAARIVPVLTEFTNSERFRRDKAEAHVREAAEQCGALALPLVADAQPLDRILAGWPAGRRILWADEAGAGIGRTRDILENLRPSEGGWAILVGPEGGFSDRERDRLRAQAGVVPLPLGPRILRAETAVVAAMALWQQRLGDW